MAALRSRSFLIVAAVIVALLVLTGAVYAYDSSREDTIADGVTIGGVDVGGLSKAQAAERVEVELADPLQRDVVARYGKARFTLTTKASKVAVDTDASVDEALERSREGNVLGRTVRGLTGGSVKAALDPAITYDEAAIEKVVDRAAKRLDRDAVDAKVDFSAGRLVVDESSAGRRVRTGTLRRRLTETLASPTGGERVTIALKRTDPKVTSKELAKDHPVMMAVDRSKFTLTLYKDLKVQKTYNVAVGQVGLDTPAGEYKITNKAENPAWSVPMSAWAGDLAGTVVPPGPSNPLKARWMGIFDGAGIHGTDDVGSLGSAASHGCVRMAVPDVIDLYDRVDVGTPIYIA
jgi:lipoprotein-anchoring transpeptidase ErfK/SrfK